jgi:hypothetical protein
MKRSVMEIMEDLVSIRPTYEDHNEKWKCNYCNEIICSPDCVFKEAEDAVEEYRKAREVLEKFKAAGEEYDRKREDACLDLS